MGSYSIFTMCSKNYKDAYDFVIDSWVKSSVDHIYIYTDDPDWKSDNKKVNIINFFNPVTDDWLINTGRRVFAARDVVKNMDEKMVFLDIDCYLTKDIGHVFDDFDFDFAVTRLHNPKIAVSAGVYFFYNTEHNRKFFGDWQKLQDKNLIEKRGVVPYASSYAQRAFSDVIRKYYNEKTHKVLDIDVDVYNRKAGKPPQTANVVRDLKANKIEVLHLYARTWRTKEINKITPYLDN